MARWNVRFANKTQDQPVTGIMTSVDLHGTITSQEYEYRSDRFVVDPVYKPAAEPSGSDEVQFKRDVATPTGSFFESSITRNWFSCPKDLDAYFSPSPTPAPSARIYQPQTNADVSLVYKSAKAAVERYETGLALYLAKLESGSVDVETLEAERMDLMRHYQDAFSNVAEYQTIYKSAEAASLVHVEGVSSDEWLVAPTPQSQRARAKRVFHM